MRSPEKRDNSKEQVEVEESEWGFRTSSASQDREDGEERRRSVMRRRGNQRNQGVTEEERGDGGKERKVTWFDEVVSQSEW